MDLENVDVVRGPAASRLRSSDATISCASFQVTRPALRLALLGLELGAEDVCIARDARPGHLPENPLAALIVGCRVQIRLMPSSSAWRTVRSASACSTPLRWPSMLGPPVPSPTTETWRPVRPSRRYCIGGIVVIAVSPRWRVANARFASSSSPRSWLRRHGQIALRIGHNRLP